MPGRSRRLVAVAALALTSAVAFAEDPFLERPDDSSRVLDPARVFTRAEVAALTATSEEVELTLGVRVHVATTADGGEVDRTRARRLLESWKSPAHHPVLLLASAAPRRLAIATMDNLVHYLGAEPLAALERELASHAAEAGTLAAEVEGAMRALAGRLAPPPSFAPPPRPAGALVVDATGFIGTETVAAIDSAARGLRDRDGTELLIACFVGGSFERRDLDDQQLHGPKPGTSAAQVAARAFTAWRLGPRALLLAVVFQSGIATSPVGEVVLVPGPAHRGLFDERARRAVASRAGVVRWLWAEAPNGMVEDAIRRALASAIGRLDGSFAPGVLPRRDGPLVDPEGTIRDPEPIRQACREVASLHSVTVVVARLPDDWKEPAAERAAAAHGAWGVGPRGVVFLEQDWRSVALHAGEGLNLDEGFRRELARRVREARASSREPLLEAVALLREHLEGSGRPASPAEPAEPAPPGPPARSRGLLAPWAPLLLIGLLPVGFIGTVLALVVLVTRTGRPCASCFLPGNTGKPHPGGPELAYACPTCGASLTDYVAGPANRAARIVATTVYAGYVLLAIAAARQEGSSVTVFDSSAFALVAAGVPLALSALVLALGWRHERFPCPNCRGRLGVPRATVTRPPGPDGAGEGSLDFACPACAHAFSFPCRVENPKAILRAKARRR